MDQIIYLETENKRLNKLVDELLNERKALVKLMENWKGVKRSETNIEMLHPLAQKRIREERGEC